MTLPELRLATRCLALLATVLLLLVGPAGAQPPLPAALQARVQAAVQAYEAGHLGAAGREFTALARQQVPAAEFNLALMHLRRELPRPSAAQAQRLLRRAAAGGFVTAQLALAQALENGEFGRRDLAEAHRWYEQAAEAGSAAAQLAMGTAHYLGRGAPKDAARAAHWFREAAKAGDEGAMYLLASMYEKGEGLEPDLRLARYWYDQAAQRGDPAAPGKVREMDTKLAPPG